MNSPSSPIARPSSLIRKLFTVEEPLFRDHLLRLDEESRHDRFVSGVNHGFLVEYSRRCFDSDTLVLGFLQEDIVRAAGELHAVGPQEETIAEVAFSVEKEYRNKGIGKAMLKRLILSARNRGFRHLRLNCHSRNLAMQAIARKFKADLRIEDGGTVGDIMPELATPFSLLLEALGNVREVAKAAINLQQRL